MTREKLIELIRFTASETALPTTLNRQDAESILNDFLDDKQLLLTDVGDTLILTKKDVEALLNGMINPKEPNEALKEAMLKFISR